MSARRCSTDGINFPTDYEFNKCPVCGEDTDWVGNADPDEDHAEKVESLLRHLELSGLGMDDVLKADVPVKSEGDSLWLHSWDLINAGIWHRLQPDDLVQVGKQTFEVICYVDERREYCVRAFSMTLSDEDLQRLADGS